MIWYDFCLSPSDLLHSVWQSTVASMLLQMALVCSFLWMSSSPLYLCVCVCVCVWCVYHVFFIHSPLNEQLGCFHALAKSFFYWRTTYTYVMKSECATQVITEEAHHPPMQLSPRSRGGLLLVLGYFFCFLFFNLSMEEYYLLHEIWDTDQHLLYFHFSFI